MSEVKAAISLLPEAECMLASMEMSEVELQWHPHGLSTVVHVRLRPIGDWTKLTCQSLTKTPLSLEHEDTLPTTRR
jgi:hypothetical protein